MKKLVPLTLLLPVLLLAAFAARPLIDELEIGSKAPMTDLEMQDVSGEMMTLEGLAEENGLLVIFSSNTCPWVRAWEDRYVTTAELADELGVGLVLVNSNAAERDGDESLEAMRARAEAGGYAGVPYVADENNRLADAFGASHTPHVYLFDDEMTLVYRGAIDDDARNPEQVESQFLADAMKAMVAGEEIEQTVSKSIGCTIKRVES